MPRLFKENGNLIKPTPIHIPSTINPVIEFSVGNLTCCNYFEIHQPFNIMLSQLIFPPL